MTTSPISFTLEEIGTELLGAVRVWLACLPFIIATFFWVVLARQAGPAMGVGIGLHLFEYLNGLVLPIIALATASGAEVPLFYRMQVRLLSFSIGYNADVLLYWGSPFGEVGFFSSAMELGGDTLLPTIPWRAVAILTGYTVLFLGWAMWILRRRDMTYGS